MREMSGLIREPGPSLLAGREHRSCAPRVRCAGSLAGRRARPSREACHRRRSCRNQLLSEDEPCPGRRHDQRSAGARGAVPRSPGAGRPGARPARAGSAQPHHLGPGRGGRPGRRAGCGRRLARGVRHPRRTGGGDEPRRPRDHPGPRPRRRPRSASGAPLRRATPSPTPTPRPPTTPGGTTTSPTVAPAPRGPSARPGTALAALAALPVKGRAPRTGYDRGLFGQAWADTDRNGCDTRNDILRRDLTALVLRAGTHGCLVLSGPLDDPYTGAADRVRARGRPRPRACRSTTWWRSPTPGRRAPSSGARRRAPGSRTTR